MWATVPKKLQLEFMNDLQKQKPTFIIYKSDIDLFLIRQSSNKNKTIY